MASPVYPVNITAGQWNLIATNVTSGTVFRKSPCLHYQTYRATGESAPTNFDEGEQMFQNLNYEPIKHPSGIDVYVWPTINAVLRVDS